LGTVNCSLEVTLGIPYSNKDLILTQEERDRAPKFQSGAVEGMNRSKAKAVRD
jgi:hypothetical protein